MEESAEIESGGQYGSNAERFKEFLMKYKAQQKFKKWTYDRMKMLRFKIYKVVHELDGQEQRPMLPSSKPLLSSQDRVLLRNILDPRQSRVSEAMEAEAAFQQTFKRSPSHDSIKSEEEEEGSQNGRAALNASRAGTSDSFYEASPPPATRVDRNNRAESTQRSQSSDKLSGEALKKAIRKARIASARCF
jgi:hypothetical protein